MQWLKDNLTTAITIAVYLISLGAGWATLRSELAFLRHEITRNADRIKALESQKTDETKWQVGQHEKRLDNHEQLLSKISDKLERMTATLERIDQRTTPKP